MLTVIFVGRIFQIYICKFSDNFYKYLNISYLPSNFDAKKWTKSNVNQIFGIIVYTLEDLARNNLVIKVSHYFFITPPLHPIFGVSKGGGLCELPKKIGACGGLSHFVLVFENMPKKSAPAAGLKHMIHTI